MSFYPALQQNHLRSGRCQTNGWKVRRIFSLMNVSVKENPFLERDFSGTMQNSAYDLQSCARRDHLQNITKNFLIAVLSRQ